MVASEASFSEPPGRPSLGSASHSNSPNLAPTHSPLNQVSQWPETVLSYEGSPDFPAFETYRDQLLPPPDTELF